MFKKLSRREMLRTLGLAAAGTAVAACQPKTVLVETEKVITQVVKETVKETVVVEGTPEVIEKEVTKIIEKEVTRVVEPTATPVPEGPATVVVMYPREDLSEEQEALFEETHPNITIDFLEKDDTRFQAMLAAGQAPCVYRSGANGLPYLILRGIAADLQPFVDGSTLVREDDLAPVHGLLRNVVGGKGGGDLFGIAKDWSPDFTLWINTDAFDEAGVPVPPDDEPLTYVGLAEIASKLVKREGDRTLRWGLGSATLAAWAWTGAVMDVLGSVGKKLYDESFSRMILVDNPDAVEFIKYWVDLSKDRVVPNPLDPVPTWDGAEFGKGTIAIQQYGYWFNSTAETDVTEGKVRMLPAPQWGPTRRDSCVSATCTLMTTQARDPYAAWTYIEWFSAEEPAVSRAKSGWGVPGLKSLYPLMPRETLYQQQVQSVLEEEMKASSPGVEYNPFYDAASTSAAVWYPSWEKVLLDEITFDELIQAIEDTHNERIKEGIDRLTG